MIRRIIPLLCVLAAGPPATSAGDPAIVFVSRNPLPGAGPGDVPGIGPRHRAAVTGGRLMVLDPRGRLRILADSSRLADVADPAVSWDGRRVLFAGTVHPDSGWRIFEVGADGTDFRPITRTDRSADLSQFGEAADLLRRYDDFDPCYLPDGRILFASTRYPSLAAPSPVQASNLFIVRADGSGMRRITTERSGAEEPAVDPRTGRIVYTRWWANPDLPSNETRTGVTRESPLALSTDAGGLWQAVTAKPDGDELRLYAGSPRTREGVHAYKPALMTDGRMLSVYTRPAVRGGAIGAGAIRLTPPGPAEPRSMIGRDDGVPPFAVDPVELDSRTILFSYSADGADYGIYALRLGATRVRRILDLPGTLELDAQPLRSRRAPPVLPDEFPHAPFPLPPTEDPLTYDRDDVFRFDCMNIFTNAGVDVPIPDAPRITRNARIRFFMNVQRRHPAAPDPSILLKEAAVMYHGGVHEHDLPAEVSLFEQVVDSGGRVLATTGGSFAHVTGFNFERQGAGTKCVGCHAGHSMMEVPINGSEAEWFNLAPSATVTVTSQYTSAGGMRFLPGKLVDRRARAGGEEAVWVAGEGEGAAARLAWDTPVEVREIRLYAIPRRVAGSTLAVERCEVALYAGGTKVGDAVTGAVRERGTGVTFRPVVIDRAEIVIRKSRGTIDGGERTGLAEIEVIGRLPR